MESTEMPRRVERNHAVAIKTADRVISNSRQRCTPMNRIALCILCAEPYGCLMFLSHCTRGSNGPVERTGGEARRQVDQSLDSETTLGSGESTRATRNGVNFRDGSETGCRSQVTRPDDCRIDAVSVGRDQLSRPGCGTIREVHRKLIRE